MYHKALLKGKHKSYQYCVNASPTLRPIARFKAKVFQILLITVLTFRMFMKLFPLPGSPGRPEVAKTWPPGDRNN